jgi:hypothetical protein
MLSADWHYTQNGQQHGPVSAAELKTLVQTGKLTPTDMVWKAGMAEWKVASSIKGLFPIPGPVPVPASDVQPPTPASSPAPVSSFPNKALFSFVDKVKEYLGKVIGPSVPDKQTAAISFFNKNRLWFGVGGAAVACIVLVLFLLVASSFLIGKKGFTQSILDLDKAKQKEYDVVVPKGAKQLYAPRSVEDFLQSLTLFGQADGRGRDFLCMDMKSDFCRDINRTNESNGVRLSYQTHMVYGFYIKQSCWDQIYGKQEAVKLVAESTGSDRRFGGGRTVQMNHWSVTCSNENVLVRGLSPKDPRYTPVEKDEVHVWFIHFNTFLESVCPQKADFGQRQLSFDKFYQDK